MGNIKYLNLFPKFSGMLTQPDRFATKRIG